MHPGLLLLQVTQVPYSVIVMSFEQFPQKLLTAQALQFDMLHIMHPPNPFGLNPVPQV